MDLGVLLRLDRLQQLEKKSWSLYTVSYIDDSSAAQNVPAAELSSTMSGYRRSLLVDWLIEGTLHGDL